MVRSFDPVSRFLRQLLTSNSERYICMIGFTTSGSFKNFERFYNKMVSGKMFANLNQYGREGVNALARATPVDTGLAATSWGYRIVRSASGPTIEWYNTNVESGAVVVILLQYGHGTRGGTYVAGRDFINPAIRPIFDRIVKDIWKEVQNG